jgi:hypothetical protein
MKRGFADNFCDSHAAFSHEIRDRRGVQFHCAQVDTNQTGLKNDASRFVSRGAMRLRPTNETFNDYTHQTPNEMALSGRCIATTSISLSVQASGIFEFDRTSLLKRSF